jgi:hypothetical protein
MKSLLASPFFKKAVEDDRFKKFGIGGRGMITNYGSEYNRRRYGDHNNSAVRPFDGHPRLGFQTMLNTDSAVPLPTAPAVVGGNVDWTQSKVTPATQLLHSMLSDKRMMNPAPATGSGLRLAEPSRDSIHTNL